ncbi:hypothetical protein [Aeromonas dhakensis]|uniref:hypothetical protein n=1 Tax=Aeromonas dhakensis TaxID=196024 RepID=UPI003B9F4B2C
MQLLDDFKKHTALALLFLSTGFIAGLGAYKYVSGFFNADVVLHDSYIYKSDIEKTHVPIERYTYVSEELDRTKLHNENLQKQQAQLLASQSSMSISICQRHASEANAIILKQQAAESSIQSALSLYSGIYKKDDDQLRADERLVEELRRYSELLNQQLIQVRGEISKCGK